MKHLPRAVDSAIVKKTCGFTHVYDNTRNYIFLGKDKQTNFAALCKIFQLFRKLMWMLYYMAIDFKYENFFSLRTDTTVILHYFENEIMQDRLIYLIMCCQKRMCCLLLSVRTTSLSLTCVMSIL